VGQASNTLTGVSALSASNIWAVGYYFNGDTRSMLILRHNGTGWSVVPSRDPGSTSNLQTQGLFEALQGCPVDSIANAEAREHQTRLTRTRPRGVGIASAYAQSLGARSS
jgi:hypothetical protein